MPPPIAPPSVRPLPTEMLRQQAQVINRELARRELPVEAQVRQSEAALRSERLRAQQAAMRELVASGTVTARELQVRAAQQRAAVAREGMDPRVLEAERIVAMRQRQADLQSRRAETDFKMKVVGIQRRHAEEKAEFQSAMLRHRQIIMVLQQKVRQCQGRIAHLEAAKVRARSLELKARVEQTLENTRTEYKRAVTERETLLKKVQETRRGFLQDANTLQRQLRLERMELERQRRQIASMRKGVTPERSPVPYTAPAVVRDVWKDARAALNISGDPVEVGIQSDVGGFQIGEMGDLGDIEVMDVAGGENALMGKVVSDMEDDDELGEFEPFDDIDDDIVRL